MNSHLLFLHVYPFNLPFLCLFILFGTVYAVVSKFFEFVFKQLLSITPRSFPESSEYWFVVDDAV